MTITQTVEITDSRRLTIDVPHEVPTGRAQVEVTVIPFTEEQRKIPVFGCAKGQFRMADDFDEPLIDTNIACRHHSPF